MPSDSYSKMTLGQLVETLVKANREWDQQAATAQADVKGAAQIHRITEEILMQLLGRPGCLIYISDSKKRKEAEAAIGRIWRDNVEEDEELWDKILYGVVTEDEETGNEVHNQGVGSDIVFEFAERAPRLKPTLISVEATAEVSRYFEESMAAWLHGLDEAAVILAWSVLENLLKEKLPEKGKSTLSIRGGGKSFRDLKEREAYELIDDAKACKLLTNAQADAAHNIRLLRKDAVHRLREIDRDLSFDALVQTKLLVEALLNST